MEERIAEINKQIDKLQQEKAKLEKKAHDLYNKQLEKDKLKRMRDQFIADLIKLDNYSLEEAKEIAYATPDAIIKRQYSGGLKFGSYIHFR